MKTIFYVVLVCITLLLPALPLRKADRNIILYSPEKNVTGEELALSAKIISARMKICLPGASVSLIPGGNEISVKIPGNVIPEELGGLLTSIGLVGFYETMTKGELSEMTGKGAPAQSSEARLACSASESRFVADSVKTVIGTTAVSKEYKLLWNFMNDDSRTCLYAVRNEPAMTKADIESVSLLNGKKSQPPAIGIRFRPGSAKAWAELTGKNLGKPLAIVLDDKVFYTPVVKTAMEGGVCEISGSFTEKELDYLVALAGNESLPVSLAIK